MAIIIKSRKDIESMRDAGKINAEVHQTMAEALRPGVTTDELDRIAYEIITRYGATPAFLNYPPGSRNPYPSTITVCINEQLVHGIPSPEVALREGDLVSLDCGTVYKGWVADSAFSYGVGSVSDDVKHLLAVTEKALYVGIDQCVVGNRFGDVSATIEACVEAEHYTVVREYGGHGVGRKMHEDPHIPNWGKPGRGPRLKSGMTFALEPMVMMGDPETKTLSDHWTVVSADGKLNAHFEHTIAVTENGPEILTKTE